MAYLLDTSILARLANTADAHYPTADRAVLDLHRRGEVLHITAQNLIEFRNLATRPKAVNGLGLPVVDAEAKAAVFEGTFPLLAETPDIYPAWKALVGALGIIGNRFTTPAGGRLPGTCGDALADVQRRALRSHGGIWGRGRGRRSRDCMRQSPDQGRSRTARFSLDSAPKYVTLYE
jgi:hypothetical protein